MACWKAGCIIYSATSGVHSSSQIATLVTFSWYKHLSVFCYLLAGFQNGLSPHSLFLHDLHSTREAEEGKERRKVDPERVTNNLQNSYLFTQAMTRRGVAGHLHTRVEGYNLGPILTWLEKCKMNEVKPENEGGGWGRGWGSYWSPQLALAGTATQTCLLCPIGHHKLQLFVEPCQVACFFSLKGVKVGSIGVVSMHWRYPWVVLQ